MGQGVIKDIDEKQLNIVMLGAGEIIGTTRRKP